MPYANNQGTRIHFEVDGQGPPLLLQHGFSSTLERWYEHGYVAELAKDYRTILVDARGHGKSDKPHDEEAYRADIIAADYTAILDELGIEKSHFFGYSMGGRIGFQSLARYTRPRLASLIIGGATPYGTRTEAERKEYELRIAGLQMAVEKGMEAYITNFVEKTSGPLSPSDRTATLANDPEALLAIRKAYEKWPSAEDILPGITMPCLVFCGEADNRHQMASEGTRRIPSASFVSFPGLAHRQVFTRADLVLPCVKKFLAAAGKNID